QQRHDRLADLHLQGVARRAVQEAEVEQVEQPLVDADLERDVALEGRLARHHPAADARWGRGLGFPRRPELLVHRATAFGAVARVRRLANASTAFSSLVPRRTAAISTPWLSAAVMVRPSSGITTSNSRPSARSAAFTEMDDSWLDETALQTMIAEFVSIC